MANQRQLISIVDDDESMREAIRGLMQSLSFAAEAFASAEDFLQSRRLPQTACLIADINMPGMSGIELHRQLWAQGNPIPTILITAYPDEKARAVALAGGVVCYLTKPFQETELLTCVNAVLPAGHP